jgi:hypothetical protein
LVGNGVCRESGVFSALTSEKYHRPSFDVPMFHRPDSAIP